MSHGGFMFDHDPSMPPPGLGRVLARMVFAQVAALMVGFALLVLLTNLIGTDFFRGPIRNLHDSWLQFVRPTVGVPLQWLVGLLPDGFSVRIPVVVIDYLAVGITMILREEVSWTISPRWMSFAPRDVTGFVGMIVLPLLLWPIILFIIWPTTRLYMGTKRGMIDVGWTQWLPPLIYCVLWFTANYIV